MSGHCPCHVYYGLLGGRVQEPVAPVTRATRPSREKRSSSAPFTSLPPPHAPPNRFYTGKGSSGGTGLGLPICKDLVEKMNGEVSIRSEKGVGTSVRIELPEAEPDA